MRLSNKLLVITFLSASALFVGCASNGSVHTSAYYGMGANPYYYSRWDNNPNIIVVPPKHPGSPARPNPPSRPKPPARPPSRPRR